MAGWVGQVISSKKSKCQCHFNLDQGEILQDCSASDWIHFDWWVRFRMWLVMGQDGNHSVILPESPRHHHFKAGRNLLRWFLKQICIDWWSQIFDFTLHFIDGGYEINFVQKLTEHEAPAGCLCSSIAISVLDLYYIPRPDWRSDSRTLLVTMHNALADRGGV